jgi:cytochrome P450
MLDNKYLIKKGGLIMIPGQVQHTDGDVWGNDWNHFNHRRFLRTPEIKRSNPVAFRSFGGGTTLCPVRHFAAAETLLFADLLTMRFDMQSVAGQCILPTTYKSSQAEAMEQPDEDIKVKLVPRPGGDEQWRITFSEPMEPQITAEGKSGDPH